MTISGISSSVSAYSPATEGRGKAAQAGELSAADQALVSKLKARDRVVRQHEQAHLSASGGLATSGASYTYQRGPDGVNYAVGGEVNIDTSPGRSPEETQRRARIIRAAALAPADPSGQDRAVAAQASKMEQDATAEIARQRVEAMTAAGPGTAETGRKAAVDRYYAAGSSDGGSLNTYA